MEGENLGCAERAPVRIAVLPAVRSSSSTVCVRRNPYIQHLYSNSSLILCYSLAPNGEPLPVCKQLDRLGRGRGEGRNWPVSILSGGGCAAASRSGKKQSDEPVRSTG